MRKVFFSLLLIILSYFSYSQQFTKYYIKNLHLENIYVQPKELGQFINNYIAKNERLPITGWRVVIFFGTGQGALSKARAALSKFKSQYPDIQTYLVYEQPYFKVKVGNFLDKHKAQLLLHELKEDFPQAFITEDKIDINNLTIFKD